MKWHGINTEKTSKTKPTLIGRTRGIYYIFADNAAPKTSKCYPNAIPCEMASKDGWKHLNIELGLDMWPIFSAPYPVWPGMWGWEKEQNARMLELEVIERASTELESPVLFAPNKDWRPEFLFNKGTWTQVHYATVIPLHGWTSAQTFCQMWLSFQHWMCTDAASKMKLSKQKEWKAGFCVTKWII